MMLRSVGRVLTVAACTLAALPGAAFAKGATIGNQLPCPAAEDGVVAVDGLLSDWRGADGTQLAGAASATVRCNVDSKKLYLVVEVRDDTFVRTAKAKPIEDHLVVRLGSRSLTLFPGDGRMPDKATWTGGAPKGAQIASARQEHGWASEIGIPLGQVPGYTRGTPSIPFSVTVYDGDRFVPPAQVTTASFQGAVAFAEGSNAHEALLRDLKVSAADVKFDQPARFGGGSHGRVVQAARALAVLQDDGSYTFVELPGDVKEVKLVDLGGDGRDAAVVRYLERAPSGQTFRRELLAVYRPTGGELRRSFAAEVARRGDPAHSVETKVTFAKRGKGSDLVLEAGKATGWDQATLPGGPSEDVVPLVLPWDPQKKVVIQFRPGSDEYLRK